MDRFLIAPFNTGLETDLKPWLIPDDAFATMENAYVFRGRIRKRFGSDFTGVGSTSSIADQLFSRGRLSIGTISSGGVSVTAPGAIFKVGQTFSTGEVIFTVTANGTPANLNVANGSATTATFNTTSGALVLAGVKDSLGSTIANSTPVFFYPSEPIMGLTQYELGPANDHQSYAFDTQFIYKYSGGSWNASSTPLFTGDDDNFFWACNWQGLTPDVVALFITNFNTSTTSESPNGDSMYVFNGTSWSAFKPIYRVSAKSNGYKIQSARIILPFKNRLLLLNTVESDNSGTNGDANISYTSRLRYSQNGSPLDTNAFLQANEVGYQGGGYIDAPTEEEIVSAAYIKDRLIVYFERSTWEVAYTGSSILPFVWQKINTELGSEATFSSVLFDKVVLTVGNTGIHACSGSNVVRVDDKIPQKIFDIVDKVDGIQRIAGIRDFYAEMVYWTFPSGNEVSSDTYPNRILAFNYKNGSWAFFDDCITSWGYFEQQDGYTWASTDFSWASTNNTWQSGAIQAQFRQVIAGNPQGFIVKILPDRSENVPDMQITNVTTATNSFQVINHNLQEGDWIRFYNMSGLTIDTTINYQIFSITDENNFIISGSFSGTYSGGGTLCRVSRINIQSKQWNPYSKQGRNVNLSKADFAVQRTTNGAVTVGYYPSSANIAMTPVTLETSPFSIYPLEAYQDRLWHTIYFDADGSCVQLFITYSDEQMQSVAVTSSDFQLEGIVLHTQPTSSRIG